MPTAPEVVAGVDKLLTLPEIYLRVKSVIDDPDASIGQLARVLYTDTAMTARVLRIVNSPLYGYRGRIDTLSRALNILGMQQVHDAVLAWAVTSAWTSIRPGALSMIEFWGSSAFRAVAARELARHMELFDAERLFVEGLLSDIGHLVMYCRVPELTAMARVTSGRSARPLHEVEREVVGCDYAEVGAALVRAWQLPALFEEPIARQVEPSLAERQPVEACILHAAGVMATDSLVDASTSSWGRIDRFATATIGLDDAATLRIAATCAAELDEVVATFSPQQTPTPHGRTATAH